MPSSTAITTPRHPQPCRVHSEGTNIFDVPEYTYITFEGIAPYEITGAKNASGTPESVYGGKWYKSIYSSDAGQVYTIDVKNLDESRTASCTFIVDDASNVGAQYGGTYKSLSLSTGTNTVKFDPAVETSVILTSNNSTPFYKVTVDGANVPNSASYGATYVVPVSEGCVVEVVTVVPDVPITVTFEFADEFSRSVITGVSVNDTNVADFNGSSLSMKAGDKLGLTANVFDSKIDEFTVDGAAESWTGSYPWSKILMADATVYLKAHKYGSVHATVKVNHPEYMTLYSGYSYQNNVITLSEGENSIEVPENNANIAWKIADNCYFTSVKLNGAEISGESHSVTEGDVFEFETAAIVLDKTAAVYVNDRSLANYYFSFATTDRVNLGENFVSGYNVIEFYDGNNPFGFNYYGESVTDKVFINDELQTPVYGSYSMTLADKDVVKIYFNEDPAKCMVTFDIADDADAVIMRDVVKTMDEFEPVEVLAGTQFNISKKSSDLKVSVNDVVLNPDQDGQYQFVVTGPSTVKVEKGVQSGISSVDADVENGPVYNLQGICVGTTTDGLPAGVYIVNGRKVKK